MFKKKINIKNTIYKNSIYIVSTPIGNIYDISIRALYILENVNLIVSENIKITNFLINYYSIKNNIISLNKFNEKTKTNKILNFINNNNNIALVSNSGTPLINDPGFYLVKNAIQRNIKILSVPGPCSVISSISVSGLSTNKFCFEGFIPKKHNEKINLFKLLKNEKRTIIFYESALRLVNSIKCMHDIFEDDRKIVIVKEITKLFEECIRNSIKNVLYILKNNLFKIKGEIIVLIEGNKFNKKINKLDNNVLNLINELKKHLNLKQSINIISKFTNIKKNELYSLYTKLNYIK